jgi:carbon-monoxide dehydrogenase medium subunit
MYPSRFHYEAPSSVDEALQLLSVYQGEAKVLSGGMSLIPLMKLRFASPSAIIDVNNIPGLDGGAAARSSAPSATATPRATGAR